METINGESDVWHNELSDELRIQVRRAPFGWPGMDSRNLPLRILYTINSSPQYILARSPFSVPVVLVLQPLTSQSLDSSTRGAGGQALSPCYGTTSLKTCLDTICRSSPELVQDVARDFSVYVLDPLESNSAPAPVNICNATSNSGSTASTPAESSNGVAVGLGLMSWALVAGESDGVTVTGTVVKQGTGKESLEVIFALREVCFYYDFVCEYAFDIEIATCPTDHQYAKGKPCSCS